MKPKKSKRPAKSVAKQKVSIKDLKAKHTESVKGGGGTIPTGWDIRKRH